MTTTTYLWDIESDNLLSEDDGTTTTNYTNEPGQFGHLVSQNNSLTSNTNFYHFDARGDTRELTDDSENVTDTKLYDAWGNVIGSTGTTPMPFQLLGVQGNMFDPPLQMNYLLNEYYSSSAARLQAPIGLLSLYMPVLQATPNAQYPPGDAPGTFNYSLSACDASVKEIHKGCACTDINVTYKPNKSDKSKCTRICIVVDATQRIDLENRWYYCQKDFFRDWHQDTPLDRQTCWSGEKNRDPQDSPTNASWTDFPGGGPESGRYFGRACPGACDWLKLNQSWQACAVCTTKSGQKKNLGCVFYSHEFKFTYKKEKVVVWDPLFQVNVTKCRCKISCDRTSKLVRRQDVKPFAPLPLKGTTGR